MSKFHTLQIVRDRGHLRCGVNIHLSGFALPEDDGNWYGFNVDYGRAISAAIFGDDRPVEFVPMDAGERFNILQRGEVDVLVRNTTWTLSRDVSLGVDFQTIIYHEFQHILVRRANNVRTVQDLYGCTIPLVIGSLGDVRLTSAGNVSEYLERRHIAFNTINVHDDDEAVAAYRVGKCDLITSGYAGLSSERLRLDNPNDHVILPEKIAKEPYATVVRADDICWARLVRWVHFALVAAEEHGITLDLARRITDGKASSMFPPINAEANRLLGIDGALGEALGLNRYWARNVISTVGNYGEIFTRNLGEESEIGVPRGINKLWSNGGLLYSPIFA